MHFFKKFSFFICKFYDSKNCFMNRCRIVERVLPNMFIISLAFVDFYSLMFHSFPKLLSSSNHLFFMRSLLLISLLIFIMWLWSWMYTVLMDPGRIEDDLKRRGELFDVRDGRIPKQLQNLPICPYCLLPQPPNSKHCMKCNACYLRYDHHCGVVGQCIADRNMKSFLLSFLYGGAFTMISIICGIFAFAENGTEKSLADIGFFIITIYVGIFGLAIILFGMCTFYDSFRDSNHGLSKYMLTFGKSWWKRLIPIQNTTFLAWPGIHWFDDYDL